MDKDVLDVARKELGNTESPAGSNRTKYGKWMGLDGQPWCMSFVQWCCAQAGHLLPYRTGSCSDLLGWYRRNHPEQVFTTPKPGDIIIYNFGHTGFVESVGSGTITAIEGNTSAGEAGSQDNGGGVFRRTRSKKLVTAYIRFLEEDEDMDKETFKRMFLEMRKELQDNDSSDYSDAAREWAVRTGLIKGGDKLPDGNDNYMWEDLLTREQMATLLFRFAQMLGAV